MSEEVDPTSPDRLDEILRRVKEVAGERCDSFVFIATVKDADDSAVTISTWDGGFNEAVGMTARMQERLRQRIIETDFPDDPGGEEWKESAT